MHTRISESDAGPLERLLYRWFVQYNPLYLVSAVLVLLGLFLTARGLTNDSSLWGSFGVGIVTELYSVALIAGTALLTRIGLRRPAVCVALIAVLYQGDLILSTEMYPLLPRVGAIGSVGWLVVFVAKLNALAWALRLRLSFSAAAVPAFGALGLAAIPYLARTVDQRVFTMVVAGWLFSLFAAALWTSRRVTSRIALDAWGATVLRRSSRAAWLVWGCLAVGHVCFWILQYQVRAVALLPVAMLLATRWMERERSVVAVVLATLVVTAACIPDLFVLSAMMSAVVFVVHALRKPSAPVSIESPPGRGAAYRGAYADEVTPPWESAFELAPRGARMRQLAWAGYAVYLAGWAASWSGGAWPEHVLALDLVITAAVALFVWKHGQRSVSWPLVVTYVHWAIQSRVLRMPQSTLSWGVTTVSLGFGLLLVSLFTSWRIQRSSRNVVA
jgi:hypothetical protein